jgi:hypothetical protein
VMFVNHIMIHILKNGQKKGTRIISGPL